VVCLDLCLCVPSARESGTHPHLILRLPRFMISPRVEIKSIYASLTLIYGLMENTHRLLYLSSFFFLGGGGGGGVGEVN
jgi:hypothetical protein